MNDTAKLIPATAKSINEALESTPDFKERYENDPSVKNIVNTAMNIEGLARHTSQHAAGVVITPVPITDVVPVKRISTGGDDSGISQIVTQFTMEPVEKLGLVKMDFLGLQTLSIIQEALENIKNNGKPVPDLNKVNDEMNDPATFKILQEADTMGVFQLESDGIRAMLRKLRIDRFEDLVAALAMYRPGPLDSGMVDTYIECKHGRKKVTYPHPLLENVLKETYGVILYQEQVMQCASALANYTLGEADILRKAMGKKKVDVMQEQKIKFLAGAEKNKIDPKTAADIFDNIEKFAGYGFNKSHSAAYALISYDTAWLKANYKVEFLASYLSSQMKAKKEVLGHYVLEVRRSGIKVLPPDINSSRENFTPDGKVIRFGFGAVSRMGHNAIEMIVKERTENGNFKSLWDFIERIDKSLINKTAVENLIKAGAFDQLHENRAQLINALPLLFSAAQNLKKEDEQMSLFDEVNDDAAISAEPEMPLVPEYDEHEKLNFEKDVTGLYMSGHPYEVFQEKLQPYTNCTIGKLNSWRGEYTKPCFGGIVTSITEKITKKNEPMAIIALEDAENNTEVVAFSRTWADLKDKLKVGTACTVEGKMGDRGQLIVDKIKLPDELENSQEYFNIPIDVNKKENLNVKEFVQKLRDCKGKAKVILNLQDGDETCIICLNGLSVNPEKVTELNLALSA